MFGMQIAGKASQPVLNMARPRMCSVGALRRNLSTRPHPLSQKATPTGPSRPLPSSSAARVQRWSTLTVVLTATLVGATTYTFGARAGRDSLETSTSAWNPKDPTRDNFNKGLEALRQSLPEDCFATDRDSLLAHGYSSWSYHDPESLPGAVISPRSTEDVVKIVNTARKYSIPLIPFSGGTSLEGHTQALACCSNPEEKEMVEKLHRGEPTKVEDVKPGLAWTLDFAENMGEIIKVNEQDLDIVVQPGITYDAINATLKEQGIPLFFPVDPAPGAMIGGMVGTGASGTNAVRYGTMRENVLNLTVVLPNGEVIKTRQRAKKSSAGPDLGRLFIGSEGTLGIITEITLKLAPVLPSKVAVTAFPTIKDASDAVRDIVQQGINVACVELLDDIMVKAINQKGGPITWEEKPSVFIKFAGSDDQMKNDIARTKTITQAHKGSKFTFSRNDKEAEDIWYSRKVALWSAIDYVPGAKCWVTDVCVPISKLPQLVAETQEDQLKEGIIGPIVGHAGDGNFHSLLLYRTPEELEKVKGLVHRMVERAQRLDGTCTGEHGVGYGKIEHLEHELGPGTVELLRDIKKMIDPNNIMNPGKLIPGLVRRPESLPQ